VAACSPTKADTKAQATATQKAANPPPPAAPSKVDYATDLFNMLSMEPTAEKAPERHPSTSSPSAAANSWAEFQCKLSFYEILDAFRNYIISDLYDFSIGFHI
jgi:hypothetical protein